MSKMPGLRKWRNQMKFFHPISLETYEIKEAISSLLSARIRLGQTIYFSYKQMTRNQKKAKMSQSQYLHAIALAFPRISLRSYQRALRVFERLVIDTGLWIADLEELDFTILGRIAECKYLNPYNRRDLVADVQKMMNAGHGYKVINESVGKALEFYKKYPKKWPEQLEKVDRRMVDVKLNVGLAQSKIDEMESPPQLPADYFDLGIPGVVLPWDKPEPE